VPCIGYYLTASGAFQREQPELLLTTAPPFFNDNAECVLTILPAMQLWDKLPDMQTTHVTRLETEARDTNQNKQQIWRKDYDP